MKPLELVGVGARQALGREWAERLRRAGLLHIVVLSGYNLSIVAAAILVGLTLAAEPLTAR
ncbi:MAG: ComEC/Rec2 family competence protein, partial [bacterium]